MKFTSNLEDLLSKIKNDDGTYDFEKGNELLESDVTKFIDKNVDIETIKAEANDNAKDEFIKELGIEGVTNQDTFKQHLSKLGAEDKAQELTRVSNEFKLLEEKYNALEMESSKNSGLLSQYQNEKFVLGKHPNADAEYLTFKINKLQGESFEEKYNSFISDENNQSYLGTVTKPTTTAVVKTGTTTKGLSTIEQRLVEQGKLPKDYNPTE